MQPVDWATPLSVAYFAHNWGDAAILRRVAAFRRDGIGVAGFAMHRFGDPRPDWVVADLGQTFDNRYLQRARSIRRGAARAATPELAAADVIVARNLDMLMVAIAARRRAGVRTPIIYECLDIHRLMVREDPVGRLFRWLERRAMRDCASLWVSSPAFLSEYFTRRHPVLPAPHLLENRLQDPPGPRPLPVATVPPGKLRIGWFGNLRCARSLALLRGLARAGEGKVEVVLRGYPAETEIPDFHRIVAAEPGMSFGGRYEWPGDLAAIYGGVDVVWAGDFMDAGKNSDWLLPNRLYEGGWFGCPPIAPATSETGKWIARHQSGFLLDEPVESTLPRLIAQLLSDRAPIIEARARLLSLPSETFIEPKGTLRDLLQRAIAVAPAAGPRDARAPRANTASSA